MTKYLNILICFWIVVMAGLTLTPPQTLLRMKYPSQTVETDYYSFASPNGWDKSELKEFDGIKHTQQIILTGWHAYSRIDSVLLPTIIFCQSKQESMIFEKNNDGVFQFLVNNTNAEPYEKIIKGKTCIVLRYHGKQSFNPQKNNNVSVNEKDSTTIYWHFKETPIYGYFWGFESNESEFWDTLETVKWK